MKFLKVSDNLSIRIDDIEAVSIGENSAGEGGLCNIHTHHSIYKSNLPYSVILEILEKEKDNKQQELNIMKQIGTFAG